jgi:hypothetical protein
MDSSTPVDRADSAGVEDFTSLDQFFAHVDLDGAFMDAAYGPGERRRG